MRTRSPAPRAVMPPARPPIRELTARAAYTVEWDVRTLYDFVFSLSSEAGSTEDLPAADRDWLSGAKAALRGDVGDAVELFASELCIVLATLAVDRPEVRDSADLVELVHATDDVALLRTIAADRDPDRSALVDRALGGDEEAIRTLTSRELEHGDSAGRPAVELMFRDPAAGLAPARAVLDAWQPRFAEVESRVGRMIRRDYEDRVADRRSLAPVDLVERTTGGVRWLAESGVRRVILAPSYFTRPYNFVLAGGDWQMFAYPIGDFALDAADPLAPPQAVVRLHRALGDETRLRILKLLTTRDWYLSEIAQQLELSKPTIKHHLALLRAAGLVTLTEEGGLSYYSLRRDRLTAASAELGGFLGSP